MTKLNLAILRVREFMRKITSDESGQGATEYILLLVVVVAIAMIFRQQITAAVQTKVSDVSNQINGFGSGSGTPN